MWHFCQRGNKNTILFIAAVAHQVVIKYRSGHVVFLHSNPTINDPASFVFYLSFVCQILIYSVFTTTDLYTY